MTNNRTRHPKGRRARRGATLVFVAFLSVVLVGVAAVAIDMSRLHTGYNELQTGADAAALRGALQLQRNRGVSPADSVTRFALLNQALSDSIRVPGDSILPIFWDPEVSPNASVLGAWDDANAVQVTAPRAGGLLFGRLLSAGTANVGRRSIAWIANITRVECPAPWGFPLSELNYKLFGTIDSTNVSVNSYDRLLDTLRNGGALSISMVFRPSDATDVDPSAPFEAIDDDNVNMNAYRDQIADGSTCAAASSAAIDTAESFPGKGGGAVPKKTADGAHGGPGGSTGGRSLCEQATPGGGPGRGGPAKRADCYPVGSNFSGSPGVTVSVSWIRDPAPGGRSAVVKTLSGFRVMCVFQGKNSGEADPAERCAWYSSMVDAGYAATPAMPNQFSAGTIVGYPVELGETLGPGTALGNAPSLGQRLILVR
ncbi:pilus assembly protein TadG-related protein [Gemmatimonas phototrophica]|uniref:pilus assembly protein TadG-related protein n=1 Tax=Gemmatimonas phototrophica TaxID=1379270 RepID=UPI0009463DC0|nr:pilus assembly protein TadG-related protein [Gemmatimonas phototrophica]